MPGQCLEHGLGVIPWSPIAQGVLSGRYANAQTYPEGSRAAYRGGIYAERINQDGIDVGNRFVALAEESGVPPVRLAVADGSEIYVLLNGKDQTLKPGDMMMADASSLEDINLGDRVTLLGAEGANAAAHA